MESAANHRTHRRLAMTLPIQARLRGRQQREIESQTKDISAGGVYFTVSEGFEIGSEIECRITLPDEVLGGPPALLLCRGKVVRVERPDAQNRIGIAATVEQYELTPASKELMSDG